MRFCAERSGYSSTQTQPWVLGRESVLALEIRLQPAPVALDTLTMMGKRRTLDRAGFERRRRAEIWGKFADSERLSRVRTPGCASAPGRDPRDGGDRRRQREGQNTRR